ncbi:MAG: hypothetical protein RIG68_23710 [Imperialibacter sp.]|uniref:hypothetical protein n=1 Tax=Imperialibacter sp. TaxID=2038411 RepID=UPI0032ED64BC
MKLNKQWHLANPMPTKPTFEQRAAWHLEHIKNCPCRGLPARLAEEMKRKGIEVK